MKYITCLASGRDGRNTSYHQEAHHIGESLAKSGLGLIYGGGRHGMMNILGNAYVKEGGSQLISYVIREFQERGRTADIAHITHVCGSLADRKVEMYRTANLVVALPGGLGTNDELMTMIAMQQLSRADKPILLINSRGIYDHFLEHLASMTFAGFCDEQEYSFLKVCANAEQAIALIDAYVVH